MWMTDYIRAIKVALAEQYPDFVKVIGGSAKTELLLEVPDGTYSLMIEGKKIKVKAVDDGIVIL
jgi:hypothetical protein